MSDALKASGIYHFIVKISLLFLFLLSTQFAFAQYPQGGNQGYPQGGNQSYPNSSNTPIDSIPTDETELDTAHIQYFFAANPARLYPENDTLLDNNFQQFDPSRHRQLNYFNLGRVASAAYPSVYQPQLRSGLDMGMHSFDLYQLKNEDIRFYYQGKAFTDAYYSGNEQNNGMTKARFARNFTNGVNFSVDFQRIYNISQINSQGPNFNRKIPDGTTETWLYEGFPRGRVSALGIGFWIHREKYNSYFTYTVNSVSQLNYGGITNDSVFKLPTASNSLPAVLTKAQTRYDKQEISYLQYLILNKKDSTGTKRNFLATHKISYRSTFYKSYDPFVSTEYKNDSTFYGSLLNDIRGLRFYLKEKQLENSFSLSTTKARVSKDTLKKVGGQNDWFEVGISHSYHNVNQEIIQRTFNNVLLRGRWNFTPNDDLKVETYAHFNILGHNLGDYRLNGELYLNLKNIGSLTVKGLNQLYEPTYIQEEMYLTQRPVWKNDFKKTLETSLSSTLKVPRLKFEGTIAYTLLNNFIYFDKTYKPQQANTPLSILQLIVNQDFKLGAFHLDNTLAIQKPTEKYLRLPDIYSKNSLYLEGKIFRKAMLARFGFDFRYATAWFAPAYMPLTGQFYVQEIEKVNAYPSVDAFMSFKVKSFRLFVKMENVLGSFSKNVYYQIYNYPVPDRQFRFGVRWNLLN